MIPVVKLVDNAVIPKRATVGSAGFDLSSVESVIISAKKWKAVSTGLSMHIPKGYYGRVAPRSGLAYKYGIDVFAGVIDSDYTGEVKVILMNNGESDFEVNIGDRVAQMVVERIYEGDFMLVDSLLDTERGVGGFGSTGL